MARCLGTTHHGQGGLAAAGEKVMGSTALAEYRRGADPDLQPTYPASGRPGPASARGSRLRLSKHRMTTAVAGGAYPFLAEAGLGAEGIFIGRDLHAEGSFCYDPFALYNSGRIEGFTNPNAILCGVIGMGKSA
ncbi:ATP-binding protein, partial [Kitasatospora sp. NPDC058190]